VRGGTITLRQADDSTLSYVETLLKKNGLPSQDIRSKRDCFYIGYNEAGPVGISGIETYGTNGLLRSVVLEQSARGYGFGTALCNSLEATALTDGIERLYLLTTTAAGFFAAHGYVEIERTDAPARIQQTTEFDELCPTTATCMKKPL
jgi:amino-acid N-acetyltransferase